MFALPLLIYSAELPDKPHLPALEAFDKLCSNLESIGIIEAKALASGWSNYQPEPTSEHAKLAKAKSQMPSEDFQYQLMMYQSPTAQQFLFAMDVKAPNGSGSIECKVIDDTVEKPSNKSLINWTGFEPTDRKATEDTEVLVWAPSHLPSLRFVAAYYVPLDSQPRFPGKGLIVSSVLFYGPSVKDNK